MAWKKTMAVFHTSGVPPSSGVSSLATRGWTRNSRVEPTKLATVNSTTRPRPEDTDGDGAGVVSGSLRVITATALSSAGTDPP